MNRIQVICWMIHELSRILQSNGHICLTWTLTGDSLNLKCFTSQIHAKITFYNPFKQEQGFCNIPQPSPACISYHKNSSIEQRLKGKETVFEVRGIIDSNVEGNWSCYHGTNVESAVVYVKIPRNIDYNTPVYVRLTGHTLIKTNDPVWLTCLTNVPMTTKLVRFYVNDNLYITLTKYGYGCYSSLKNDTCSLNECKCSADGRKYSIQHQGFKSGGIFTIECKAEFEFDIEMSDCMMINVIDIDGPRIIKKRNIPFLESDYVELVCFAFIDHTDVRLAWECLDFQPNSNFENATYINSVLSFKVNSSMNGKTCTCNAIFKNIKKSTSLTIDVSKSPVLGLLSLVVCNKSTEIQLICNGSEELHFESWVHTYNGYFIRNLRGLIYKSRSTLSLGECSYEDEGEYMCMACTKEDSNIFCNNISSTVVIKGLPLVTEKHIYMKPALKFMVKIYAVPQPIVISWFVGNEKVENSTRYVQSLEKSLIERSLHKQAIQSVGFTANLTVKIYSHDEIRKTISILIQNNIGNITAYFDLDDKESSTVTELNLKDLFLVLFGMVILILVFIVFACLFKHHSRRSNRDIETRTMYYTVEPVDSNFHQYDISEPLSSSEEIESVQLNEHAGCQQNEYEEIDKDEKNESDDDYEIAHEYIEVL